MASLEHDKASGRFRIRFRFAGEEYKRSLKVSDRKEADGIRGRVEETILLLERGRLVLPAGADVAQFILSDGKLTTAPVVEHGLMLGELIDRYERESQNGSKEKKTRAVEAIHLGHIQRILGVKVLAAKVTAAVIQTYVTERSKEKYRDRPIKTQTVRKEIGTLQSVYSWALHRELVPTTFSTRRLEFAKGKRRMPFQTYEEIERTVNRGGLSEEAIRELWDGLFLDTKQIADVLSFVETHAPVDWLYPMVVAAAHTGARRSELLRAQVEDFNFTAKTVLVREKKKSKTDVTFRVVDMTPFLAGVLSRYFAESHPGGSLAFVEVAGVELTDSVSQKAFRRLLDIGKWKVLRGYHVFRHSFASNLARAGVDPRVVDELMGHQTEAMRKRYSHMFPDKRRKAVESVFGAERRV